MVLLCVPYAPSVTHLHLLYVDDLCSISLGLIRYGLARALTSEPSNAQLTSHLS